MLGEKQLWFEYWETDIPPAKVLHCFGTHAHNFRMLGPQARGNQNPPMAVSAGKMEWRGEKPEAPPPPSQLLRHFEKVSCTGGPLT